MPIEFLYKARNNNGEEVVGVMRGDTQTSIQEYLDAKDLIPISIKEKTSGGGKLFKQLFAKKIPMTELVLFTRKLATLYKSGLPLTRALQIISNQDQSPISVVADKLSNDLEKGDSFSEAISHHPHIFSEIYINSIRIAEDAGRMDTVLDKMSDALERDFETKEQIKAAIRYPVIVVALVIGAFIALMILVVPRFAEFYANFGAALPLPTKILINLNHLMQQYWYIPVALVLVMIPGLIWLFRLPACKKIFDGFLLKIPIFGSLLTKIYISRFSHLLEVFFGSGAPLLQGLEIIKSAVGNRVIGAEIELIKIQIQEGSDLADIKDKLPHFSNLALSMIQVGLESGSLEYMLNQVAGFLDREVDYTSKRLMALIEPFLIIFLGGVVLFLALAIFLPMWNMIEVFKPH